MTGAGLPTRRAALAAIPALAAALAPRTARAADPLAAIERRAGGRLGAVILDTGTGALLSCRADERFLQCSTFKLLAAAAMLARVETGIERLDRRIGYTAADILPHSAATQAALVHGAMTVGALCQAAITLSDNTAANLLLAALGGPAGLTAIIRATGDGVTRLDRTEPALNERHGVLDTTTPRAIASTWRHLLLGPGLGAASRLQLAAWLAGTTTGLHRIRAGVPASWAVGDKTGTCGAQANDIAILQPPGGLAPLIAAAFYEAPGADDAQREGVLRAVGTTAAAWVGAR